MDYTHRPGAREGVPSSYGSQWTVAGGGSENNLRLPSLASVVNRHDDSACSTSTSQSPSHMRDPSYSLAPYAALNPPISSTRSSIAGDAPHPVPAPALASPAATASRKRPLPSTFSAAEDYGSPGTSQSSLVDDTPSQDQLASSSRKRTTSESPAPSAIAEDDGPGSKELKNSRRAAQNRAAQRAFRERKEQRIKVLEQKAEELDELKARQTSLEERWKRLEEREAAVEQMMKNVQATKPAPQHSIRAKSEGSPSSFDPQAFDSTERNPGVRHYGVKATCRDLSADGTDTRDWSQEMRTFVADTKRLETQVRSLRAEVEERDATISSLREALAQAASRPA